jgi:hypothetical protein
MNVHEKHLSLDFDTALDPGSAADLSNYEVHTWQLLRSKKYGSDRHDQKILKVTMAKSEGKSLRVFTESVDDGELKWHRDRESRMVEVIESDNWKFQLDNELPTTLIVGEKYLIPEGVYHRIIKGNGDLKVSITFL